MTDMVRKGQAILWFYLVAVVLVSVHTIFLYVASRGPDRLFPQLVRLALTVVLCFFLFRGSRIAKGIAITLFTLGGAVALPLVLQGTLEAVAVGGGLAALYLSFAWLLIWSRNVNAFQAHQRGEVALEHHHLPVTPR